VVRRWFPTGLLLFTVLLIFVLITARPAWALTVTQPVTAGQPITFTGDIAVPIVATKGIQVYSNSGCTGAYTSYDAPLNLGSYSFTLSGGLPAGSYCATVEGDPSGDVPFTVSPTASPSSYVPVTIGGTLLSINRLQVILPWIILITLLGIVSVWTLIVKRRHEIN
jgi:hypothetical protein